jgi:dTDP-4-amino-4,6-dideoxygalactose transaminase
MPVHLFGLAADMDAVNGVAGRHGLAVIEDAACAIGTVYRGRPVGGLGSIACFSFHPRKVITTGEGGMLTTDDADLATAIRRLRNHGASPAQPGRQYELGPFHHVGFNYRLSDIQAAVGVAQMDRLDSLIAERRALARRYDELLKAVSWIGRPAEPDGYEHTYQSYVVWVTEDAPRSRNDIMLELERQGIQTRPGTVAVHTTGFYRDKYELSSHECPVAFRAQERTLTLPLFPGMTAADQERVVDALQAIEH